VRIIVLSFFKRAQERAGCSFVLRGVWRRIGRSRITVDILLKLLFLYF